MTKKVSFGRVASKSADEWVSNSGPVDDPKTRPAAAPIEPMKRLTIDVPKSLHTRIKAACALRGSKMVDEIRTLLEREYANIETR